MNFFDNALVALLPMIPKFLTKSVAARYVAGATLADAVSSVESVMEQGGCATVDVLGENVESREASAEAVALYRSAIAEITKRDLDSNISLKPTHLGLRLDRDFCMGNIEGLVSRAEEARNLVRIDMEDHTTTTDTLDIYLQLRERYRGVGVAVQSYLRRSENDVRAIATEGANFRLCKGIYTEPLEIAFHEMSEINASFMALLEIMFEAGSYVGIATHDDKLIEESERLVEKLGLGTKDYEFQMLLGVKERTRRDVISRGHKLRVYVPFGEDWFPYGLRRLKENPRLARHALREALKWERFP
jgi:proline dehydrogenase